ncbi:UNVERIFIED_CONTAM: hypothetical protein GTU68_032803 [Idotea baltica]|nr:hypothetical protein [Idotea baltica]
MDIHKGLGNSNKLMNRILYSLDQQIVIHIASIDGGSLRNAIPRESVSTIWIENKSIDAARDLFKKISADIKSEYTDTDAGLTISLEPSELADRSGMDMTFQRGLIRALYACPNGIYRMSPTIKDLVQTSNNLARVEVANGKYRILCLTRSSVDSEKMDEAQMIKSVFELIGADVDFGGSYPGWTPKPDAPIVKIMKDLYIKLFNDKPNVNACHAGLECGILGTHYPDMQMISFGPNIRGAHSPDEKVQISSVQKFWNYLLATLENIPAK